MRWSRTSSGRADLVLEPLHRAAERGRADVARAAGLAEVQRARKVQELPQSVELHGETLVAETATQYFEECIFGKTATALGCALGGYPHGERARFQLQGVREAGERHRRHARSGRGRRAAPLAAAAQGVRGREADRRDRLGLAGAGAGAEPARLARGHGHQGEDRPARRLVLDEGRARGRLHRAERHARRDVRGRRPSRTWCCC